MMKIYGDMVSGNCLKVKYVADHLHKPYEWVDIGVVAGEARTSDFLAKNPAGQVPVIEFDDGRILAQSNAIMRYLAADSSLVPMDPWLAAKMDEWLFWEQYSHETSIAVTRFHMLFQGCAIDDRDPVLVKKGEAALDLMENHLQDRLWFVGETLTLADIALFAYTQFAPEAGFLISNRKAVESWLGRVRLTLETV